MTYKDHFQDRKDALSYDEEEYSNNSYSSYVWNIEKDVITELMEKLYWNQRQTKYLDFACGSGRLISFLEHRVGYSVGIDVSDEMLKIAEQKVRKSDLKNLDITESKLDDIFDVITAFRFFLNAGEDSRNAVLHSIYKMMHKDSVLIFSVQGNTYSFRGLVFLLYKLIGKNFNQMSYWDVKRMLASENLRIVEFRGVGIVPQFIYKIRLFKPLAFLADKIFQRLGPLKYISHNLIFMAQQE